MTRKRVRIPLVRWRPFVAPILFMVIVLSLPVMVVLAQSGNPPKQPTEWAGTEDHLYDLSWWTVDGGGGAVGGGTFTLLGTAGQPEAGPPLSDAAGRFTLLGGFWPAWGAEEGNSMVYLPLVLRAP